MIYDYELYFLRGNALPPPHFITAQIISLRNIFKDTKDLINKYILISRLSL